MTDKVRSKYKFFGGFGLLLVMNLFIGILLCYILVISKISIDKVDLINNSDARFSYIALLGAQLLLLLFFLGENKYIIADADGITFINPLFPFLIKTKTWDSYDYFITVDEKSKYSTHEAVWLIKDEKISNRFSSFCYSNYDEIKEQIKTNGKGKQYYNSFGQLFALLRIKKIKN